MAPPVAPSFRKASRTTPHPPPQPMQTAPAQFLLKEQGREFTKRTGLLSADEDDYDAMVVDTDDAAFPAISLGAGSSLNRAISISSSTDDP
ncbi:hypothetical protein AURDEDRAFT_177343, partial [Auricularia subglabra TFB-10046 SS5]